MNKDEPKSTGPKLVEVSRVPSATRLAFLKTPRARLVAGLVVLLLLCVAAGAAIARPWGQGVPDGAAFVVGDTVVTEDELTARLDALRALYGIVEPDGEQADEFLRDAAKSMAVSVILENAQEERNIEISDKQARDVLDRYIVSQFGDGGRDAFVQKLGEIGTSERAVLTEIKRQLALGRLMDDVVGEIEISDEELKAAFVDRKEKLATPELRAVSNIVVKTEEAAKQALARIKAGESFADVAADVSIDEATKDKGGALGEVARSQLEQSVGDAAFSVDKGQTYGPVKGRFGWNIGIVTKIIPGSPAEFDKIKEAFRNRLASETEINRWQEWLGDQIESADVRYADKYRPASPNSVPSMGLDSDGGEPPGATP